MNTNKPEQNQAYTLQEIIEGHELPVAVQVIKQQPFAPQFVPGQLFHLRFDPIDKVHKIIDEDNNQFFCPSWKIFDVFTGGAKEANRLYKRRHLRVIQGGKA